MSGPGGIPTARVERLLPAPPTDAYDAWLEETALASFVCPAPGRATEVEVDARLGGSLRFLMSFPDHTIEVTGEFVALDRPERICFTWRCSDTGDLESLVTVLFAPVEGGRTLMTIIHSQQPPNLVYKHLSGWSSVADQLEQRLAWVDRP